MSRLYTTQRVPKSRCPTCRRAVTLMAREDGRGPMFYLCRTCGHIAQAGVKTPVRPGVSEKLLKPLERKMRMLNGRYPFNHAGNICYGDGYFAKAIEQEFGEAAVRRMQKYLDEQDV